MSSLHHDPAWGPMRAGLNRVSQNNQLCYKPKDQHPRFVLTQYTIIATKVVELVAGGAEAHIKARKSGGTPIFRVNPRNALQATIAEVIEPLQKRDVRAVALSRSTGISVGGLLKGAETAVAYAGQFFDDFLTVFGMEDGKEQLLDWQLNAAVAIANFGYAKMGFVRSDEPISWREDDLAFFGVESCNINPAKINCAQFALLQARVVQAKSIIFAPPEDEAIYALPDLFIKWGYRRVDALNEGDLVLYYHNNKPSHLAYYAGDGWVLSKLGLMNSHSHRHALFAVPMMYGDSVVFYRKGPTY
jgi:hypothetical protein